MECEFLVQEGTRADNILSTVAQFCQTMLVLDSTKCVQKNRLPFVEMRILFAFFCAGLGQNPLPLRLVCP